MTTKKALRLNMPIDIELNDKLETYADSLGLSKAAATRLILNKHFEDEKNLEIMQNLIDIIQEQNKKI